MKLSMLTLCLILTSSVASAAFNENLCDQSNREFGNFLKSQVSQERFDRVDLFFFHPKMALQIQQDLSDEQTGSCSPVGGNECMAACDARVARWSKIPELVADFNHRAQNRFLQIPVKVTNRIGWKLTEYEKAYGEDHYRQVLGEECHRWCGVREQVAEAYLSGREAKN